MKKILSKVSILLAGIIVGVTITACATDVVADKNSPFNTIYETQDSYIRVHNIIDTNTGVNYIVVTDIHSNGIAVTPRLQAYGTLYISE